MDILKKLLILELLLFPIAELGKIQLGQVTFSINDFLIGLLFIVWIIKSKINSIKHEPVLKKPIMVFIGISMVSLIINATWLNFSEFFVSFLYLLRWIAYSSLYFILVSQDKKFLQNFKFVLILPISIFLIFGFIQYIFYQDLKNLYYLGWDEHLYRLFSTFLDPNFAGAFFVLTLVFFLYLIIKHFNNRIILVIFFILAGLNLLTIFLTYSRSALIMLIVTLITFFLLLNKKILLIGFLSLLLILIFISPKAFQTEGTNILRITSSEARIDSAKVAIDIFSKNPILGVGFNAYRFAQYKYGYLKDEKWILTHSGAGTDNSYLFILATTGVVGFLGYMFLVYKVFRISLQKKSLISKVLFASLIGLLFNSLFINSLFYVYILEWIWIMAALTENS